jgi:hypothetical protein
LQRPWKQKKSKNGTALGQQKGKNFAFFALFVFQIFSGGDVCRE